MAWVALLLGVGQVVLILTSWLLTAAMPESFPRSLLSAEGIRWFFGRFVGNVESPLLVWLLLFSFMLGALQHSGILHYRSSEPPAHRHAFGSLRGHFLFAVDIGACAGSSRHLLNAVGASCPAVSLPVSCLTVVFP